MSMTKKEYKINLSNCVNLNYLQSAGDQRVLYYKSTGCTYKYIILPPYITLKKIRNELFLTYAFLTEKKTKSFFNYFLYWLRMSNRKLIKRFVLKGLGFRFFSNDSNSISFKIGFSHIIEFNVPKSVSFSIPEKNKLYLFGYDLSSLGNFYKRIRKLKLPNPYTGKGILLKNEKFSLKPIKKN